MPKAKKSPQIFTFDSYDIERSKEEKLGFTERALEHKEQEIARRELETEFAKQKKAKEREIMLENLENYASGKSKNICHLPKGSEKEKEWIMKKAPTLHEYRRTSGVTFLHAMVLNGDLDYLKTAVDAGARLDVQNNGQTLLHFIAQGGIFEYDFNMAKYLIAHKLDVNAIDNEGKTPLHYLADAKDIGFQLELAKAFLEAKANANISDHHGDTPLSIAIKQGDLKLTQLILDKAQIDPKIKPTLVELAKNYGQKEIETYLKQAVFDKKPVSISSSHPFSKSAAERAPHPEHSPRKKGP